MKKLCIALVALSLLASGCSNPEEKYYGSYTGSIVLSDEANRLIDDAAKKNGIDPAMIKEQIQQMTFSLELKDDGTYSSSNGRKTSTGTWSLDQDAGQIALGINEEDKKEAREQFEAAKSSGTFPADMAAEMEEFLDKEFLGLNVVDSSTDLKISLSEIVGPIMLSLIGFDLDLVYKKN